jgi:hypothetical protein
VCLEVGGGGGGGGGGGEGTRANEAYFLTIYINNRLFFFYLVKGVGRGMPLQLRGP